jgi:hypothetical protein
LSHNKAIYTLGNAPEWQDVVENLRAELGWEPFYWITVARNHDTIGQRFPTVHRHQYLDLNRCFPAAAFADCQWRNLDAETLSEFGDTQQTAIEMMDRMDLGGTFTYDERRRTYLWHLAYWLTIIDREKPRVVVFNVPPHSPGQYVLHEVCRKRGVEVRVFLPTPLSSLHLVGNSFDAIPNYFLDAYRRRLSERDLGLNPDMQRAIDEVRSVNGFRPWYIARTQNREARRARQKAKIEQALENGELDNVSLTLDATKQIPLLQPARKGEDDDGESGPIRRIYRRPDQALSAPVLTKDEYRAYQRWAYVEKIKLEKAHQRRVTTPDLSKPYVFLALHYQPERTTCPDGWRFNNQFLAAALLAHTLPEGWQLYVKEHPSQFSYHSHGEQSRRPEFYDDIVSLPNTQLVPLDLSSRELLLKARAVATVTGFVGWESLVNEIPTIVFGAAWYRSCRGVWNVANTSDAKAALTEIAEGHRPKLDDVVAYAGALQDTGVICYANTSLSPVVDISSDQLVDALTSALLRFEQNPTARRTPPQPQSRAVEQAAPSSFN